jgi:hypothetical protein
VAHVYNPCYSEGRDQEDHGLRPAQANVSWNPILKIPTRKRADRVAQVWQSTCLASVRPCVQTTLLPKIKKGPL